MCSTEFGDPNILGLQLVSNLPPTGGTSGVEGPIKSYVKKKKTYVVNGEQPAFLKTRFALPSHLPALDLDPKHLWERSM